MEKPGITVGDIIDARCTKCLKVTNHVIVAMVGDKPAHVQCNTCSGKHRYRKPVAASKAAKRPGDPLAIKKEEWDELRTAMIDLPARDYAMDKEYRTGTILRHQTFGLGLVQRIIGSQKMEVLFEDGKKIMRCK